MKKTSKSGLKIGFIGLGLMGNPMAKNILKAGFELSVYNRTKDKTHELGKLGAKVFDSPQELALNVDIVITMITGPKDVKEVLFGKEGVVKDAKQELIVIDMSTIGPKAAKDIALNLNKFGIEFIDAPVTGSVPKAITGELTIFAGGDEKVFKKARPVLEAMGGDIKYIGGAGSGQAVKLINNLLVASCAVAIAQGLLLSDVMNLSRNKVKEALENVPAMSPFMKMKIGNMVKNDFTPAFSLSNMHKDLRLALIEAKGGKNMQFLKLVEELYKKGMESDFAEEDMSAVIKVM